MVSAATCGWIAWLEHVFGEVSMGSDPSLGAPMGSDPLSGVPMGSGPFGYCVTWGLAPRGFGPLWFETFERADLVYKGLSP